MGGFAFPMIVSGLQRPRSASGSPYVRPARHIVRFPRDPSPSSPYCIRTQNNHRYEQTGNTACHQMCSNGASDFRMYRTGGRYEESKSWR